MMCPKADYNTTHVLFYCVGGSFALCLKVDILLNIVNTYFNWFLNNYIYYNILQLIQNNIFHQE